MKYDYCIIGGGIVGLATAMSLLAQRAGASLLLLEKEDRLGAHQTGHNSGVIHAGIYYAPGSAKAKLCREGLIATREFCAEHDIPMATCGKLIVATNRTEEERIEALYDRATANGLRLERVDGGRLRELEPNISGLSALRSPETGMVSYQRVAQKMAEVIQVGGGEIRLGVRVDRIVERADDVEIGSGDSTWRASQVIACAGIQADRLARLAGLDIDFRMVPFRGEYYRLPATKNDIVSHHIYPAPDPALPFLGIHLTRMIDGSVTVGPNAVVGLSRENYRKSHLNLVDVANYASFPGFWRLIGKHASHAAGELANSLSKRTYLSACQKYCPGLSIEDLLPYQAGIRAQAVKNDGVAVHDFLFAETNRTLHVCNAPSPAATSSIPIGRMIASKVMK